MKDQINLSKISLLFLIGFLTILAWFYVAFLAKLEWRLSELFLAFAVLLTILDFYYHNFRFKNHKIIQKDTHLYLVDKFGNLNQVAKIKYNAKFFVVLKLERGFNKHLPLWQDSLSPQDWHWLKINLKNISIFDANS